MAVHVLLIVLALRACECVTRTYYIDIREESWNYAPTGTNLITGKNISEDADASEFLQRGPYRIGSVYMKAIYRQYTDASYNTEVPKPDWLGFLGPVLRAEVGDVMVVHLRNSATRTYSLHPHGVFYKKNSEGALYPDGTSDEMKQDDAVPPGKSYTYTWEVKKEFAPTEADANCLTWVYHSHVDAPKDIASGLIGCLLTCKTGVLQDTSTPAGVKRSDVDKDFFLMFNVVDENLSWYLQQNIMRYCPDSEMFKEDEDFTESNLMHSINGFVYGNLPNLKVCFGQTVSWHLFGMGNEVDIHSAYFHGHTLLDRGHRTDVVSLFPATFVTAEMVPRTIGKWMLSCQVNDHIKGGMQAFYEVSVCAENDPAPTPVPHERHYFIAAEETLWDYAPTKKNTFTDEPLTSPGSDSEPFFSREHGRLGGQYVKARYIRYTDETFTEKMDYHGSEQHLGILGPVIRAETGDVVVVMFLNKAKHTYSIQPHGLQYEKAYEGAIYNDGSKKVGASVSPGERFTYRWRVKEGPSDDDPPCLSYLYYSASNPVSDTNSGLMGPIQVCKSGHLDESGYQKGVDKEFFLLFTVIDENESWYLGENIDKFGNEHSDPENEEFQESNKMHAVNGYMYGNLPDLDLCEGDLVLWHMLGLGTEVDIHGVYFQGNTFRRDGTTRDTLSLFPHTTVTVTMTPDNDGTFELSCRTTDHYRGGMRHPYTVKPCKRDDVGRSKVTPTEHNVQFFLAAEEMEWDYAPNRTWELLKHHATLQDSVGNVYLKKTGDQIGSKYKKVVYREYTDKTFTTQKPRGPQEEHLGILGPILRVEVGERVQIVFKNKASKTYSVHAHGVRPVTSEAHLSPAQPGSVKNYIWDVPERSGPGPSDPNCITFAYYSTADVIVDLASGLVGPLVVCRKGTLNSTRHRTDVQQEFALLFMVFDENESGYLEENIKKYLQKDPNTFNKDEEAFLESNMMHAINGRLYGNLKGLDMTEGEKTDWYLLGLGNEVDMHTVHFHAQSFTYKMDHLHRADVLDLFPGTFQTIELVAGTPGTWLLHCHVTDHIHAGMETTFTIHSKAEGIDERNSRKNGAMKFTGLTPVPLLCLVLLALSDKM